MFKKISNVNSFFLPPGNAALRLARLAGLILPVFLLALPGCQTIPPLPAANLKEPGWTVHQGQAVWHDKKEGLELAGELLVAVNPDGRSFVQFTKTPFPMVIAQTTSNSWQIQDVRKNK